MIVIERANLSADDTRMRAECLELLAGVQLIHEVESYQAFASWLDEQLAEMESGGYAPLLRRVVLIGDIKGPVCRLIAAHLMPGKTFRVLPQPTAWREIWQRRGDIALALGGVQ